MRSVWDDPAIFEWAGEVSYAKSTSTTEMKLKLTSETAGLTLACCGSMTSCDSGSRKISKKALVRHGLLEEFPR